MVCIPRKEITTDETLGDLLDKGIALYPDKDALVYAVRDFRLSCNEFVLVGDRVA